jgi:hypothetical protein
MFKSMNNDRVLWASQIQPPSAGKFLHVDWDYKLVMACHSIHTSAQAKSLLSDEQQLISVCRWFIEALYQADCSFPPVPLAVPQSSGSFTLGKVFAPPFGYRITKLVVQAAISANFVIEKKGVFNPDGKGSISRFTPAKRLKAYFIEIGHSWQYLSPPDKEKGILIAMKPKGKERRYPNGEDPARIKTMQKNLNRINRFLAKQCIWIDLPNSILLKGISASQHELVDSFALAQDVSKGIAVNFQNVFLRRIFAQSFEQGGRFYGGWWQSVKSELRPRILINDYLTSECDFSSLSLRMLYAEAGLECGDEDLYDIGFTFPNDPIESRKIVKRYINALLNDKLGKYRLSPESLRYLGVSQSLLFNAVCERHTSLLSYFHSGVGLRLQFMDSQIAEQVMLHFISKNEVCLPVHDSFIVRRGLEKELQSTMETVFKKFFQSVPKVKSTSGYVDIGFIYFDKKLASPLIADAVTKHIDEHSIMHSYHISWERTTFTKEQIILRDKSTELVHGR